MSDGSAVILSVAKYYSPSGKAIQDVQVTPNILVADADLVDTGDEDNDQEDATAAQEQKKAQAQRADEQLKRAVAVLKNKG
jgi:carboxyl-terminal processing protease